MNDRQPKLTTTSRIRELRNLAIVNAFKERYEKGDQITPLIEDIATEQSVAYSTAYKVIKEYRDKEQLSFILKAGAL